MNSHVPPPRNPAALTLSCPPWAWTVPRLTSVSMLERSDGPLHAVATAEYYLAANSPRVELPQIEQWLQTGRASFAGFVDEQWRLKRG